MSSIFFSADHHFFHKNIIQYQNRPFQSVEEMNYTLIENHNKVVGQYDEVYFLGDFSFQNPVQFLKRMNGKIHLCRGNHDIKQQPSNFLGGFEWVKDVHLIKSIKPMIFMSHYCHFVWPHLHHGAIHIFGHSHGNLGDLGNRSMDVGVDTNNYFPYHIDEVIKKLDNRPFGVHH